MSVVIPESVQAVVPESVRVVIQESVKVVRRSCEAESYGHGFDVTSSCDLPLIRRRGRNLSA